MSNSVSLMIAILIFVLLMNIFLNLHEQIKDQNGFHSCK